MTAIVLPPDNMIEQALFHGSERARQNEDTQAMRAYDNAAGDFARGARPALSANCWLVPSSTRNMYHRVRKEGGAWGCNCEFGVKRGGICRHVALIEALDAAWEVCGWHDDDGERLGQLANVATEVDDWY